MITIISTTNRSNSKTSLVAAKAFAFLKKHADVPVKLLSFEQLDNITLTNGMYSDEGQHEIVRKLQDEFMIPAAKFLFVMPEYNGSFPGVLKLFLDACSVRENKATFNNKKAALVGVASGRAGNLRGIDHFKAILNHVGTTAMPGILPISSIGNCLDEDGNLDGKTSAAIEDFVKAFCAF